MRGVKRLAGLVTNVWALIVAIVVVALSMWFLVWRVDGWESVWMWLGEIGMDRESRSTTVRNVGLSFAGFVAILFALWRSRVASRHADIAYQSLLNERYQKAADMLGSGHMSVRLGGIYALQALIKEEPRRYYVQCMNSLCAFVREPTGDGNAGQPLDVDAPQDPFEAMRLGGMETSLRADVQAVMDMMCQRNDDWIHLEQESKFVIDLRGAHLIAGNLRNVNLSGADLKAANLSGAYLAGANLARAGLSYADLTNASLYGGNLSGVVLGNTNVSGTQFCLGPFNGTFSFPVTGLTDYSLHLAYTAFENPPQLGGVVLDAERGFPLEWNGRTLYPE